MNRAFGLLTGLVLTAVAFGLGQPARASSPSPVSLVVGSTMSYNGINYTVSFCNIQAGVAGTGHSCTTSDNMWLAPTGGPGSSVIIEALDGGANGTQVPLLSAVACGNACPPGTLYDINLTLDAEAVSGTVSSVGLGINGSASASNLHQVSAGETVSFLDQSDQSMTVDLAAPTSTVNFVSTTVLSLNKDLRLGVDQVAQGSTLVLNYVTQSLTPASVAEPASLALLLTGIASLVSSRRRKPLAH